MEKGTFTPPLSGILIEGLHRGFPKRKTQILKKRKDTREEISYFGGGVIRGGEGVKRLSRSL